MNILFKYLISGGTAAFVDLVLLHILDGFNLHYILSVNIAFIFAFIVSFSLQKYWTFNDSIEGKTHIQLIVYFTVSVINVFINTFIIYLLLKYHIVSQILFLKPIVLAQIISSVIIAIESFIVYRFFIFKKDESKKGTINILIVTQKVDMNDSYFGFFHDWIMRFATSCEKVTVIALEVGKYNLPNNVKVLALSKGSKIKSLKLLWKYSISETDNYDTVFCHMSPIYVISGYIVWKILNKKISLWYVHRSVDLKLRIATILVDRIFTATPESYRIKSKKIRYMGQAVDINRFMKPDDFIKNQDDGLKVITVGRVTPIKNIDILIKAIGILKTKKIPIKLSIAGAPVTASDFDYKKTLEDYVKEKNMGEEVVFLGPIANKNLPGYYWQNDICVNLAPTGGLDKTVLEAMAAKMPVVLCNKAFTEHLGSLVGDLLVREDDIDDLAEKLASLYEKKNYSQIGASLYAGVVKKSSLDILIQNIVRNLL